MDEIINTKQDKEDKIFDEVKVRLTEIEHDIQSKYSQKFDETFLIIETFSKRIDSFTLKLNEIEKQSNKDKFLNEEVNNLKSNQYEFSEKLTTLEVQSSNISKILKDSCTKYDRIFIENLFHPGIIGDSNCRFKTMKEYIENSLNVQMSLVNFKEKAALDIKNHSSRLDSLYKTLTTSLETLESNIKSYITNSLDNFDKKIKTDIQSYNERIDEIRMENHRYAVDLKASSKDLKNEAEKTIQIQSEIYEKFDKNFNMFKEMQTKNNDGFYDIKRQFDVINQKFEETAGFIKDIRFRRNLQDVNKGELKKLAIKISDNKKYGNLDKDLMFPDIKNNFNSNNETLSENEDEKGRNERPKDVIDETLSLEIERKSNKPTISTPIDALNKNNFSNIFQKSNDENPNSQIEGNKQKEFIVSKINFVDKEKLHIGYSKPVDSVAIFFDKLNEVKKEYFQRFRHLESKVEESNNLLKNHIEYLMNKMKNFIPNITEFSEEFDGRGKNRSNTNDRRFSTGENFFQSNFASRSLILHEAPVAKIEENRFISNKNNYKVNITNENLSNKKNDLKANVSKGFIERRGSKSSSRKGQFIVLGKIKQVTQLDQAEGPQRTKSLAKAR